MENNSELIALCEAKAQQWLTPVFDADTQTAVKAMLENEDKTDLIECFYKNLEFGTGGLRGIMGAGSNRMNVYTVPTASKYPLSFVTIAATIAASLRRPLPIYSLPTV